MARRKSASGLNPKQERFVQEYLTDLNATKAAERAGYRHPSVQGCRLLTNVKVAAAIATGKERVAETLQCTADDIARELHKLAFSNMADFMVVPEGGDPYLDLSKLTRDQSAALHEVTVDAYTDRSSVDEEDNPREVKRVKVKLYDKRQSLMDLAKLLGFVTDKHELTGKGGTPLFDKDCIRIVVGGESAGA